MNLHRLLQQRLAAGRPVRVGLIGAGKFGSMFLAQVPTTPGIEVAAIADLAPDRAREACRRVGWDDARIAATRFTDDSMAMMAGGDIEVVVEATGHAPAGIAHARRAIAEGKHIVMVNVEADVLAGSLLAREAERAGVVYSLAYGDQPALICEMVDWARACGFRVIAAGKGTKYLPEYHASTPDDGLGLLRPDPGSRRAHRRHEPADVQLVPGRHEIRHRDGRGRQRHRPDAAAGRVGASRPAARTNWPRCCGRATPARCITPARSR